MDKVLKIIDRATDYILMLFFLLIFLIGAYTMYDTVLVYDAADGADLRSFRPVVREDEGVVWDMSAISEDMVAWLTIDDTNIDYPVMQGVDNNEYLNKDPFGKYSLGGSIFLDSRNAPDFSDGYSLIYGHHMEYGKMFGALDKYLDEEYFNEHRHGTLIVGDSVYDIEFFAVLDTDASEMRVFSPTENEGPLELARNSAVIFSTPKEGNLIALSTCKFPQTTARIVLLGVLI